MGTRKISSYWLSRERSESTPPGIGNAGNQIYILHAMILLYGFQSTKTPQPSRASVDKTAGNSSHCLSTNERIWRPGPSRGGCRRGLPLILSCWIVCAILIFSSLAGSVGAISSSGRLGQRWSHGREIEQHEEILLDRNPPPVPTYGNLRKRKDDVSDSDQASLSSSLARPSFASTAAAVDETETARPSVVGPSDDDKSSTTIGFKPPPTSSPSIPTPTGPLPKPFDGGFGTNYTQQSCPTFLRSMLNNETFSACLPLSLLLQVSDANRCILACYKLKFPRTRNRSSMPPRQKT